MLSFDERKYWIAFSVFPGVGPVRFKLLLDYFGSAKAAWEASSKTLRSIKFGDRLTEHFDEFRKTFSIDQYVEQLHAQHVSVLTLSDEKYPALLKQISDAPFVLYIKGRKGEYPMDLARTIGVVGTRKITPYGEDVTRRIVSGLVSYGFTIVSGMAYGVDAVAHKTAIEMGGKTIAVLGCGIDIIAPPSNASIYHQIAEDGFGAIVSEMPLGLRPGKGLFPARNRIISGLSLGVIVTEGAEDSGSLISARNAVEQGREVFAVPGPITSPYSHGPAQLIKKGAKLVESVEDILEELGVDKNKGIKESGNNGIRECDTEEERKIVALLSDRHVYIDDIVRATNLTAQATLATLTVLEMKGIVKEFGIKEYGMV